MLPRGLPGGDSNPRLVNHLCHTELVEVRHYIPPNP